MNNNITSNNLTFHKYIIRTFFNKDQSEKIAIICVFLVKSSEVCDGQDCGP